MDFQGNGENFLVGNTLEKKGKNYQATMPSTH